MRLPRFLWVPFELGRPFGAPHEPEFQRRVLHDALALLERSDGPVVLEDFPDDAPAGADETVWACPVSFAPAASEEPGLVEAAAEGDDAAVQDIRLAADDLRTWYLHAAAQQPGRATSHERNTWFWRETAAARLLGQMTARLLDHPDPSLRMLAARGLVPRDHFDVLVHAIDKRAHHA